MTSRTSSDRPDRDPRPRTSRRRRWLVGLVAVAAVGVTTVATAAAYVVTHDGNQPPPAGVHTVDVYTVDDEISTVIAPAQRPGVVGRFIGMCDADTYYVEVNGVGSCVVLNGSLGTVRVTSTGHGVELDATQATMVRDIVRRESGYGSTPTSRVMLGYDGGWAGMVEVADLDAGGPVTGKVIG